MNLQNPRSGFTLIELMVVVAIIGILAAIAIPNFIKFQARSKKGEARSGLKGIFTAEKSYFQEKNNYSNDFAVVGFAPERGNRFLYAIGGAGSQDRGTSTLSNNTSYGYITADTFKFGTGGQASLANTLTSGVTLVAGDASHASLGSTPSATDGVYGDFYAQAVGQIDSDSGFEVMGISSQGGSVSAVSADQSSANVNAVPGSPFELFDDVAF